MLNFIKQFWRAFTSFEHAPCYDSNGMKRAFLGSLFGGKKGGIKEHVIEDPYKVPISKALSPYFESQIGKGLPRYPGVLSEPFDAKAYGRYQDFLSLDPEQWYKGAVEEPTLRTMREEQLPLIREGWAGALRGSGRFRDEEDLMRDTALRLGEGRYAAQLQIPQTQFQMAQEYKKMKDEEFAREYADWYKSLPEMNPSLAQALTFLAGPTGRDVVTYNDPGSPGIGGALIGLTAMAAMTMLPGIGPAVGGILGIGGGGAAAGTGGAAAGTGGAAAGTGGLLGV